MDTVSTLATPQQVAQTNDILMFLIASAIVIVFAGVLCWLDGRDHDRYQKHRNGDGREPLNPDTDCMKCGTPVQQSALIVEIPHGTNYLTEYNRCYTCGNEWTTTAQHERNAIRRMDR